MAAGEAHERIAEDLRRRIRAGETEPGEPLPGEAELADGYGEALPAVRRALGLLRAEGLVEGGDGRGDVVRRPRRAVRRSNDRHQWEKDRARTGLGERLSTGATERDTGLEVDDLVFSAAYHRVEADAELSSALGVPAGTALLERLYRTRHRDEPAPFNLVRSYLVVDHIEGNRDLLDETREPWPGGTQSQLHTVGIELDRIEERVTARLPTGEEAERLGLGAGTAVMVLHRTSVDTRGRAVEWSEVILPGDRTEAVFTTPLERW
ncbi:GntR family transcriptional regulator [Nocardiopsis sp. NPDC057823]|uniref:GntR family transcriptional regulator n=1 Tax=Nocardiopsis sp. NPDC057823 TaxID=3346256 RepID=UPI00366EE8C2